jgi:Flp pilus assembly pilin Flp
MLKKIKSSRGQSLIEYLIIVAIVAVGTMAVVRVVGKNVSVQFANIAKALGSGDDTPLKAEAPNVRTYKKRDLSNFLEGATSGESK